MMIIFGISTKPKFIISVYIDHSQTVRHCSRQSLSEVCVLGKMLTRLNEKSTQTQSMFKTIVWICYQSSDSQRTYPQTIQVDVIQTNIYTGSRHLEVGGLALNSFQSMIVRVKLCPLTVFVDLEQTGTK